MSFANFLELELLDHVFGKGSYTPPIVCVGLSTTEPNEAGGNITEPTSAAGYRRVTTSGGSWNAASSGLIENAAEIAFAAANSDWGAIGFFFLADTVNVSSFNCLMSNSLQSAKTIGQGDTARFSAGDLEATLD